MNAAAHAGLHHSHIAWPFLRHTDPTRQSFMTISRLKSDDQHSGSGGVEWDISSLVCRCHPVPHRSSSWTFNVQRSALSPICHDPGGPVPLSKYGWSPQYVPRFPFIVAAYSTLAPRSFFFLWVWYVKPMNQAVVALPSPAGERPTGSLLFGCPDKLLYL